MLEFVKANILSEKLTKVASNRIFLIISFSILTAISAKVVVPVLPVPFTLQTMAVVLAGAFLGKKNGFYSQILYLAMGAAGLPVFASIADGTIGFFSLFGPTGGYLLAFPVGAYLTGLIVERYSSYSAVVGAMFLGNVVIIISGALYLDAVYIHNISESLKIGGVIFSLWTVVKVFAAASIYFSLKKISKN
jgi:biotin transport system substrate-specific component